MCPQARLEPSISQHVFGASDLNKITMKDTERCRKMEKNRVKGIKQEKRANTRH